MILVGITTSRITFIVIRVIKTMMMMFTALVNQIMMTTMIYVKIMIVILTVIIPMTLIVALLNRQGSPATREVSRNLCCRRNGPKVRPRRKSRRAVKAAAKRRYGVV